MSISVLTLLTLDIGALLLLGVSAAIMPVRLSAILTAGLSGFAGLLCSLALLARLAPTTLTIPVGPPGLSLQLVFDPLSAFFLLLGFLSGTAIAVVQASTAQTMPAANNQLTALCLAGTGLALLAGDGVTLTIGMMVTCGVMLLPDWHGRAPLAIPLLLLMAICLLTPAGFAPRFDTIRAAPIGVGRAFAAAAVITAAAAGVSLSAFSRAGPKRCWTRAALSAGVGLPAAIYLLVRVIADLCASVAQGWSGNVVMLLGSLIAVMHGWRAAAHPDLDGSINSLIHRQGGLATVGIGLAMICRAEDLPAASSFAFAATFLSTIGGSLAGTAVTIAAGIICTGAGSHRLSNLGGLIGTMPGTSAVLAAGLFALSALPSGLGFAGLWLLLEAILTAPRTGGVLAQLPLGLTAGAITLSAALATAAAVRVIGIALLGRPRSSGSGAETEHSPARIALWVPAGAALLIGILPGPCLRLLADPSIHTLAGIPAGSLAGFSALSTGSPGYLPLSVLALVALMTGAVVLVRRWRLRGEAKIVGPWTGGMVQAAVSPFGEPYAQSGGEGFVPALPRIPLPNPPRMPDLPWLRALSPVGIIWIVLAGFGTVLVILSLAE